ncbi:hypothetical protein [Nocardia sp. XZ_19_231]|uniref:hypothetical protein n=1 Tax=Nocardia sp. XZ_19_231 TaxID=2769252 RepID=UPI00188F5B61|nr:hypothetical protein [Nocardia sp. XZ_19_231]
MTSPGDDTQPSPTSDDTLVTLEEWATAIGRHPIAVRSLRTQPDFPQDKGTRPRQGRGNRYILYSRAELDEFLNAWEQRLKPDTLAMPESPDEFRTLGAIASLVGLEGKSITQYRELLDADPEIEYSDGGRWRTYRTAGVIAWLNERKGHGVARDPDATERRGRRPRQPK